VISPPKQSNETEIVQFPLSRFPHRLRVEVEDTKIPSTDGHYADVESLGKELEITATQNGKPVKRTASTWYYVNSGVPVTFAVRWKNKIPYPSDKQDRYILAIETNRTHGTTPFMLPIFTLAILLCVPCAVFYEWRKKIMQWERGEKL
jgi:hypothetical protein